MEICELKSDRPFPGRLKNSDRWFTDSNCYLDQNPEWIHGGDANNFKTIFGYNKDMEDRTKTVKLTNLTKLTQMLITVFY